MKSKIIITLVISANKLDYNIIGIINFVYIVT